MRVEIYRELNFAVNFKYIPKGHSTSVLEE